MSESQNSIIQIIYLFIYDEKLVENIISGFADVCDDYGFFG